MTNTNPSLRSTADRSAAGKTSASRMPSTSIQTSFPRSLSAPASRWTNSESRRE